MKHIVLVKTTDGSDVCLDLGQVTFVLVPSRLGNITAAICQFGPVQMQLHPNEGEKIKQAMEAVYSNVNEDYIRRIREASGMQNVKSLTEPRTGRGSLD